MAPQDVLLTLAILVIALVAALSFAHTDDEDGAW